MKTSQFRTKNWAGRIALGMLCAFLANAEQAAAQDLPRTPQVVIDAGMHTAPIRGLAVDAAERFVVTGGDDKTLRVWDAENGEPLMTIRLPIGPGNPGRIFALDISPDGQMIAAGGWTGADTRSKFIYVFNTKTGEQHVRLDVGWSTITALKFSPNGQFLVAGLGTTGLRVYRTSDFSEVAKDQDYNGKRIYGIAFAGSAWFATVSYDGHLRKYDSEFQIISKVKTHAGSRPYGVAISPNRREIAISYTDILAIDIHSSDNLELVHEVAMPTRDDDNLPQAVWSYDGNRLCAGGEYSENRDYPLFCWEDRGRGRVSKISFGANNTVAGLVGLRSRGFIAAGHDQVVTRSLADGTPKWTKSRLTMDPRGQRGTRSMRVSEMGDVVQFGLEERGRRPTQFALGDARLTLEPAEHQDLRGAITDAPGLELNNWTNSNYPTLNGKPLELKHLETARSLAIAPDHTRFVIGADWSMRLFDRSGAQLWRANIPSEAWSVTVTGDGETLVAGLGDGTIRWYDMADGREMMALFVHAVDLRWVAWTPEGFFAASEGGEDLMGYHMNQDPGIAPRFVRTGQLYEYFYRPDLLMHRLARNEGPIREALAEIGDIDRLLLASRPPTLSASAGGDIRIAKPGYLHEVVVEDQGGGIGQIEYRVNGVVIKSVDVRAQKRVRGDGRIAYVQPFELGKGRNEIETRAFTKDGKVASEPLKQTVTVTQSSRRPALYGLAVGIDAYYDGDLSLKYAADDAFSVKQTLEARGRKVFRLTDIRLLTDQAASKANIKATFAELAAKVEPNDVFVLYLSGHGYAADGRYHFIPQEFAYTGADALKTQSLGEADLTGLLATIKAQKSLVILDTCYAGAFGGDKADLAFAVGGARSIEEKAAIDRLMRSTGRAVLAASTDRALALEGYKGHGLYTYALLEALRGQADKKNGNNNGAVSITEISGYLQERVPALSLKAFNRRQIPMFRLSGQAFDVSFAQ